MRCIGMLKKVQRKKQLPQPIISYQTSWLRAPESGILRTLVPLGAKVTAGQVIAMVADPLGARETPMTAPNDGVVIGRTNLPLVYEGDATFHIALYGKNVAAVVKGVEQFQEELQPSMDIPDTDDLSNPPII